ncbi:hypothetical protein [Halorubrum sp. 2020YC2]|uniref:hypothetical protein n=1 Tax=Halorubrum sp. 2020YC2 TaxID=2836432 RepID=UPI001BECDFE5|nr:hypothetical protein [Halorubrum sp. 2020YC2]QWC20696.1 hypothetical protein KI388_07165 [Halorubrum sp. 2020YC2]
MSSHPRRAVLATLASVGLAGCTSSDDSDPPSEDELPDQCPTSANLDVTWPRDIYTRSIKGFVTGYESVAEFVKTYEEAYLVERNTDHRFESYSFSAELDQTPDKLADGFHVTVRSAGAGHLDGYLTIQASEVDSDGIPDAEQNMRIDESVVPDDPEYISIDEVEDQILQSVLQLAADSGYKGYRAAHTTQYEELIEELPPNASLNDRQIGVYINVDGTPVLLTIDENGAAAKDFGQIFAQYYVTEYVIRRTGEKDKSPQDGRVVECRPPR